MHPRLRRSLRENLMFSAIAIIWFPFMVNFLTWNIARDVVVTFVLLMGILAATLLWEPSWAFIRHVPVFGAIIYAAHVANLQSLLTLELWVATSNALFALICTIFFIWTAQSLILYCVKE